LIFPGLNKDGLGVLKNNKGYSVQVSMKLLMDLQPYTEKPKKDIVSSSLTPYGSHYIWPDLSQTIGVRRVSKDSNVDVEQGLPNPSTIDGAFPTPRMVDNGVSIFDTPHRNSWDESNFGFGTRWHQL
jgi:hypothetical protein